MTTKDFNGWNKEKQTLNKSKRRIFPKVREIWLLKLGINIGAEQDGKENFLRPILIVKVIGNLCFGIPLTKSNKQNKFYQKISANSFFEEFKKENSLLILSQGRTFSLNRFIKKAGKVEVQEFLKIKEKLKEIYL